MHFNVAKHSTNFFDYPIATYVYFVELIQRQNGYDAGYVKNEYDCNHYECECAHFDQAVIGE